MKNLVIIIYENITREYDNCLLLKYELERRGYIVKLKYKTESISLFTKSKLIIIPNCYTLNNEKFYRYVFGGNEVPLLSLQCEQVFTMDAEERVKCYPDKNLSNVYFTAWGMNYCNILLNIGIKKENIRVTGSLQLDFCKKEFLSYYYNKDEIAKIYNLDINKKWVLFISSLTLFVNSPYFKHFILDYKDKEKLYKLSELQSITQKEILSWFERKILEDKHFIFIYRKHPVEEETEELKRIKEEYPDNFYVISDLNVKQWIIVSDYCCNWNSTSAIEISRLKKQMILLRPINIPYEYEYKYMNDMAKCNTYTDFDKRLSLCSNSLNILPTEKYNDFYLMSKRMSYISICDYVEDIIKNNNIHRIKFESFFWIKRIIFLFKNGFAIKLILKNVYKLLFIRFNFKIKNNKFRNKYCITQLEDSAKFHNINNINGIEKKLKKVFVNLNKMES